MVQIDSRIEMAKKLLTIALTYYWSTLKHEIFALFFLEKFENSA
jgi:hypothetical protein